MQTINYLPKSENNGKSGIFYKIVDANSKLILWSETAKTDVEFEEFINNTFDGGIEK